MKKLILSILFVLTCSIVFSQTKKENFTPLDKVSKKINKHITFMSYSVNMDTVKVNYIIYYNFDNKTYATLCEKEIGILYPELLVGITF
jgi:uncharacterized protein YktB (UPF0637 family)